MRNVVRVICIAVGFTGSVLLYWQMSANPAVIFGANNAPPSERGWMIAYGYLMTVVGVFCGAACRQLIALRAGGMTTIPSIPRFFSVSLRSIDFWLGLFGSPLVFASALKGFDGQSLAGLTLLALQNGFTCTIIIATFLAPPTQATSESGSGSTPVNVGKDS